ncbi:MAG: magnesium transporter CorA family protein [Candidatus Colwellbacteria bacterium]|nr:magnesium transporter CorA family protein [Candidatus Colwellbacteria bacterium]
MIEFYYKAEKDKKLKKEAKFSPSSWIFVENPSEDEIQKLTSEFKLEEGLIMDGIDPQEVPRMEVEGKIIYVYARVPFSDGESITTVPILMTLGKDFFATVSNVPIPFLRRMVSEDGPRSTEKIEMLIKVFSEVIGSYNGVLTDIRRGSRRALASIENVSNKEIVQLISFENVINDFLSALIPMSAVMSNLLSGKFFDLREDDHELVEDLFLSIGQLIELSKSTLKTAVNVREAYSTIMTNNLNRVIKILTALTIVLTIPMLISSFFGMNVPVPLAKSPYGFQIILITSVGISGLLVYILNKNKWL